MIILRGLIIAACVHVILAGAGQGIGVDEGRKEENLSSTEVAESVKQEVYLKTANTQPIQIDRVRRGEKQGTGSSSIKAHSLHRTPELDEVTHPPRVRRFETRTVSNTNNEPVNSLRRTPEFDEVTKAPGMGYLGRNTELDEVTRAPGIGYGINNQPSVGRGTGTIASTYGIGSGTGAGEYNPGVGHGVKIGGKPPAVGSGVVDDIAEVGYGTIQTTRRTYQIGQGVNSESKEDYKIGKGTTDSDSLGDSVVLESDKDGINTALGDEVKIGSGIRANRARRNSQFDRFDTGFAKECNSYYGKVICYRVYTNPSISTPSEYTCWRVSHGRKNCTEIDNIVYLKNQGFKPDEYEVSQSSQQQPRPREDNVRGQDRYYDPYSPAPRRHGSEGSEISRSSQYPRARDDDGILHGQSGRYDPYNTASSRPSNNQGSTHRFVTSSLKLGQSNSLELDNDKELYREKRKRSIQTRKAYHISPYNELLDEYEQTSLINKPKNPQQFI